MTPNQLDHRRPTRFWDVWFPICTLLFITYVFATSTCNQNHGTPGIDLRCVSNVRLMGTAMLVYLSDNNDRMMLGDWCDSLQPYAKRYKDPLTSCPVVVERGGQFGYAMNREVIGVQSSSVAEISKMIVFFETDSLAKNLVSDVNKQSFGRHGAYSIVGYLDSHAKRLRDPRRPFEKP
ncbi:MAG: hypothetical protein ABL949_07040 [Fimbriimonadaceae bacterium]